MDVMGREIRERVPWTVMFADEIAHREKRGGRKEVGTKERVYGGQRA